METASNHSVELKPSGVIQPVVNPGLKSDQNLSPPTHYSRPNQVSTVMLYDVAIVCLWIDGKERLCLAQISNTLLKEYSYNEIHNRRVALGITCVQCTPVQLEILRRAGAMPVSSRRCGMITKREAERLVKSFLEDIHPPKLPEDFTFDVVHNCGWGCKGDFYPSRYNSSRAKCVKCKYCNMFFSANKFIFHYHRLPDSKYNHPDAANFNSWRRHLVLDLSAPNESRNEDLLHAWEDVKAMFNGGSRKRMLPSSLKSSSTSVNKINKLTNNSERKMLPKPIQEARSMVLEPSVVPFMKLQQNKFPNINNHGFYTNFQQKLNFPSRFTAENRRPELSSMFQRSMIYPTYEMVWAQHLGLNPLTEGAFPVSSVQKQLFFPKFQLSSSSETSGNHSLHSHINTHTPLKESDIHDQKEPSILSPKKDIFRPYALGDSPSPKQYDSEFIMGRLENDSDERSNEESQNIDASKSEDIILVDGINGEADTSLKEEITDVEKGQVELCD